MRILIPARKNAPETTLFVDIVSQDKLSLNTKPYVFMLPGGPGANHSHYKDYRCLTDVANIVFYDPRGCGLSDKGDPSTYTMENYIQDLNYICQYLNLPKIILLGKSYGAKCALGYTLRYPEAVSKLILAAGSPSYRNLETAKENVLKRGTPEQIKVCEKLWEGAFKNDEEVSYYFKVMSTLYSFKQRNNQPVNRPVAVYPYSRDALNLGFSKVLREFDFEEQLGEIRCKTLILVGEHDWITSPKYSEIMAKKIPESQLIIFPDADHSLESDVPDEFFETIREFIPQPKKLLKCRYFGHVEERVNKNSQEKNNSLVKSSL